MPFSVAEGDTLEMKLYAKCEGQVSVNVRHYRVSNIVAAGRTDAQILTMLDADISGLMRALLNEHATFLGTSLQIIKPIRRPAQVTIVSSGAGTFLGEVLPKQVAGLITFKTDEASRRGRGRIYVPFPSEAANGVDGVPSAAYMDLLDDLAVILAAPLTATGGGDSATVQPVIYHRATGTKKDILSYQEKRLWATQRRRSDVNGGDRLPF